MEKIGAIASTLLKSISLSFGAFFPPEHDGIRCLEEFAGAFMGEPGAHFSIKGLAIL
jgi:hypothetical protein